MAESDFIGFIHWPRLWAGKPPNTFGLDPKTLEENVWKGELGKSKIPLRIQHEGSFLFSLKGHRNGELVPMSSDGTTLDEIVSKDEKRCDIFNAYLYCLYACYFSESSNCQEKMAVKTKSLIREGEHGISAKQDEFTIALTQARFEHSYIPFLPCFADFRNRSAPGRFVDHDTLTKTADLFSTILDSDKSDELIRLCSLQLQAYVSAEQHMYRHSLVHAFMVSEFILSEMYVSKTSDTGIVGVLKKMKELDVRGEFELPICNPCRKTLDSANAKCLSGKSTTGSVESGNICLNRVRLLRNRWIHDSATITLSGATEAIRISEHLLKMHYGIEFRANVECSAAVW